MSVGSILQACGGIGMKYTIKQVAEQFALSAHTLRYYEKEGLLPLVTRDENGNRLFGEADLEWLVEPQS